MRALVIGICALAFAACGGGASDKAGGKQEVKATVLTFANGDTETRHLDDYVETVERLSGGTLRIEFTNAWRLGEKDYEAGLIGDVAAGKADLGWAGSRAFGGTALDALGAPLLIQSYAHERAVLESPLAETLARAVQSRGVVGLGILPGPLRRPLASGPLAHPRDFAGVTLAAQRSSIAEHTLGVLGGRTAEIPVEGAIDRYDGVEQHVISMATNTYDRAAPYLAANVNLWPRPIVIFANPTTLDELTERQRVALRDAPSEVIDDVVEILQVDDAEGATALCRRGVTFVTASDADLAALRRAVRPVYARLQRDPDTRRAIGQIEGLRQADSGPDAPECSRPGQLAGAGQPTPLDGVWTLETTREQLASVVPTEGDIVPENYGSWRFVLRRGKLRYTQSNGDAERWTTADYTVQGNTLTFTVTGYGGEAPTNSAEKTGEEFSFSWSLYRDRLTLKPVEGKISPEPFLARAWTRVGDAP